jgi:hypothetical protein
MSDTTLKIRLEELEKAHAFIALHYTMKAAEHLEAWARTHEDLGEKEEARGVLRASGYLMELADELGKKADVGVGDLT